MIPTFRPWAHTSDDSYIYQLSLVVATATVSLFNCIAINSFLFLFSAPYTQPFPPVSHAIRRSVGCGEGPLAATHSNSSPRCLLQLQPQAF